LKCCALKLVALPCHFTIFCRATFRMTSIKGISTSNSREQATVRNPKKVIQDMMIAFAEKYPDKGYLIVVDEFLSYLTSRDERQIVLDLEFFRALGEMCSKSKLRVHLWCAGEDFRQSKIQLRFRYVEACI